MKEITLSDVDFMLRLMQFLTPKQRNFFIQSMNKDQMEVLQMAFFNLATNHRGLSKKDEKILSLYKRKIETIASKNFTLTEKRKILSQKGGFLPVILPILGTLITSFLASR